MAQSLNTNEARIKTRRTRRDRKSHSRRRQSEGDESLPFGHRRRSDDSTEFHQDPHYRKASSGIATAGKKGWLTSRNFSSSPAGRLLLGPREICSYFWCARHLRASFRTSKAFGEGPTLGLAMPIRVCVINQPKGDPSVRAGLALSRHSG